MTTATTTSSVYQDAAKMIDVCIFLIVIRNARLIQIANLHLAAVVKDHALKKLFAKVIK